MQPILESRRLVLRPFLMADASEVQRLAGRPEVSETTLNIPYPYEDGMAEDWISSHSVNWENRTGVSYAITLQDTNQLIGAVSLSKIKNTKAELGYWIGQPYWGRGYCTEAAAKLIESAPSIFGIFKIRASHLLSNAASGRVLQKIGLSYVGKDKMRDRNGGLACVGVYEGDFKCAKHSPQ